MKKQTKKEMLDKLEGYSYKRVIHRGWEEYQEVIKVNPNLKKDFPCLFGKYQYLFESPYGKASLVRLANVGFNRVWFWEVLINGYTEKFVIKQDAVNTIKKELKWI